MRACEGSNEEEKGAEDQVHLRFKPQRKGNRQTLAINDIGIRHPHIFLSPFSQWMCRRTDPEDNSPKHGDYFIGLKKDNQGVVVPVQRVALWTGVIPPGAYIGQIHALKTERKELSLTFLHLVVIFLAVCLFYWVVDAELLFEVVPSKTVKIWEILRQPNQPRGN